jgi:glucose-1-phosphate cytidylyltransferase
VADYVRDEESFCFTYGDGLSDVDISATLAFHNAHGKLVTVTAVQPPGRYGAIERQGNQVSAFVEKPRGDGGLINGGYFVISPSALTAIAGDQTSWEGQPLTALTENGEVMAYEHQGFWQAMDTLRDKTILEEHWSSGRAPWKKWL